jgi:WD40 repeat protein
MKPPYVGKSPTRFLAVIFTYLLTVAFQSPVPGSPDRPELIPQTGHNASVNSVVFSPDGRWIASGSEDNTIDIWEVSTGQQLRTLTAHKRFVNTLAFSRDGHLLASGSMDGTIKLWDVATWSEMRTLSGHVSGVNSVAFSGDGALLASGSWDNTVKLWEVRTGRVVRTLSGHTGAVVSVSFSPNNQWIASGSLDTTIKLWKVVGEDVHTLTGHTKWVQSITFSPDGRFLASGGDDKTIRIWDAATGVELRSLNSHSRLVATVAFSPDGALLASGSGDKTIKLWDVGTWREIRTLKGSTSLINSVSFSPDNRMLASGSSNSTILLWNLAGEPAPRTLAGHTNSVGAALFSPDGRWLASGGSDKSIKLWAVPAGRQERTLGIHQKTVCAVAFSPDSHWLASGSYDNTIKLWDVETGRELFTLTGHTSRVCAVAFNPDGRSLASASWDGTLKVWDVAAGREVRTLTSSSTNLPDSFQSVAFSPDGQILAAGSTDSIKFWNAFTGQELPTLRGHTDSVDSLSFSPDGRRLASASWDGTIKIWDLSNGKETFTFYGQEEDVGTKMIRSVSFSPDGRWLASGGNDKLVKLWDSISGRELKALAGHASAVNSVGFSRDQRFLVSGSSDGSTRIWDGLAGKQIVTLLSTPSTNDWLAVTPEGLFDGSEQGMKELVAWRIRNHMYPPDRFFSDFYTSGLLELIFSGQSIQSKLNIAALSLPPDSKILVTPTGSANSDQTLVAVHAEDLGGGIKEVSLYQNGHLINTRKASQDDKTFDLKFQAQLVPGENVFRGVAISRENVEGNDDKVRLMLHAPGKAVLHVLVVGINEYEDSDMNLQFAREDGEAIARFFEARGTQLFTSIDALRLFDKDATGANIRNALEELATRAKPEDVLIVYLAGHGVAVEQQFYFLPHEMHPEGDNEEAAIRKYGLSAVALGQETLKIKALKQVLILDACQSEQAVKVLAKMAVLRGPNEERKAIQMLARADGIFVLAASTKQQYASAVPELGHGVLTYALLTALGEKGEPQAPTDPAGLITILSLLTYVNKAVPELAEKYNRPKQYPVFFNTGMDFPLVVK